MFKLLALVLLAFALLWLLRRPRPGPTPRALPRPGDDSTANHSDGESGVVQAIEPEEIVRLPLTDVFDLHSIQPREVGAAVDAYISEAARLGYPTVRVIHGRGIGVARDIVRRHLGRHPAVRRFRDAPPPSHWGATIVELRQDDVAPDPASD